MNCPECGKPIETDQNFCRDCGKALTARPRVSRMQVAGLGVVTLVFGGLIAAMFGKMLDARWLIFTGVIVMFLGIFIIAAFGVMREMRPRKRPIKATDTPMPTPSIEKADTTSKLLPLGDDDYIPSVIENTTDLLETPVRRHAQDRGSK